LSADTTLKGTGTVTLAYNGSGAGVSYVQQTVGGVTLNNEQTIQGQGIIGNGGLSVDNQVGGTVLANVSGGTLNFLNGGALTNEGSIQVAVGSSISDSFASTTNSGSVTVGGGGASLNVTGTYKQTAGTTVISSGGTLSAGAIDETGGKIQVDGTLDPASIEIFGVLSGTGTVVGDVTNDGTVIGGDSILAPGTLTETGSYTQNLDGTFDEDIASKTLNSTLDASGDVTLDGNLNIDLLAGFVPVVGDVFDVISFGGTESGAFANITGSDAGDWTVYYGTLNAGQVDLKYTGPVITGGVPDATGTLALLALALGGLFLAGRRRRIAA